MAKKTVKNNWFVSVETPKQLRLASPKKPARQTKTFLTEIEAKEFAKEMLSNKHRIVAGTLLSSHQPARRIISGSQLYSWVNEVES
jgi:hypothetical protein